MERVENREIAFARHAEHVAYAVDAQLIDQNFGGGANIVLTAHRHLRGPFEFSLFAARGVISFDCREMRR